MALAVVRDLREHRVPASEEELADFETDVLAGFVLARASAGLVDSTIRNDTNHLELIRDWFGRPLWELTFVEGLDTIIAAKRLGIAPTTARTHLQRLFAKTGTARQSELVRFVATYVEELR